MKHSSVEIGPVFEKNFDFPKTVYIKRSNDLLAPSNV